VPVVTRSAKSSTSGAAPRCAHGTSRPRPGTPLRLTPSSPRSCRSRADPARRGRGSPS
jgi:hypothetical protein